MPYKVDSCLVLCELFISLFTGLVAQIGELSSQVVI